MDHIVEAACVWSIKEVIQAVHRGAVAVYIIEVAWPRSSVVIVRVEGGCVVSYIKVSVLMDHKVDAGSADTVRVRSVIDVITDVVPGAVVVRRISVVWPGSCSVTVKLEPGWVVV